MTAAEGRTIESMRLVLVTGAGASRNLGREGPLPLMDGWSDLLCDELDARAKGLAKAAGLRSGFSGPVFEAALGMLLRWRDVRHLEKRFDALRSPPMSEGWQPLQEARNVEADRLELVVDAIHTSLYNVFGGRQIDPDAPKQAYAALLDRLPALDHMVCATTNYDPSLEMALVGLGREHSLGFVQPPGQSPTLQPTGVVDWRQGHFGKTPVLHLHGAVGWYQEGGEVTQYYSDKAYNETLGTPVVLYPDPEKDPTRDAVVRLLWDEFTSALEGATHVLVLGHSLNDPALNEQISSGVPSSTRLGWCLHDEEELASLVSAFPNATPIFCDFGSQPVFEEDRFAEWVG